MGSTLTYLLSFYKTLQLNFPGFEPGRAIVPIPRCNWNCPLKNGQGDNLSPSKFMENLKRKHTWRDLLQYRNCRLNQNMHGKCILSHIVHSKFILKSRFSHALLNKDVSWSTKRGERTWQSLPWHIENVFEQQKAFLLQIEARLNQRNMIHKMNSVLIRQKWMRIKRNWKKSQTFRKTWLWDHTCLRYEKEAVLCYFCRKSKKTNPFASVEGCTKFRTSTR